MTVVNANINGDIVKRANSDYGSRYTLVGGYSYGAPCVGHEMSIRCYFDWQSSAALGIDNKFPQNSPWNIPDWNPIENTEMELWVTHFIEGRAYRTDSKNVKLVITGSNFQKNLTVKMPYRGLNDTRAVHFKRIQLDLSDLD